MAQYDNATHSAPPDGKISGNPLRGQHALVTGATRGIGAAIAETLGRLGANLTLLGRDTEKLRAKSVEISKNFGAEVYIEVVDITDAETMENVVHNAVASNGAISILVNNAGIGKSAPFKTMKRDVWDEVIRVNLTGTFICTQAVIPSMLESNYGRVINISSTAGLTGYAYVTAYSAAKHGVVGLTRSLALEVSRSGITVNAVCPGYTETDLVSDTIANIVKKTGRSPEEARAELTRPNPMARLVQPWEVAETAAWLALPSSSSITGQAIPVAGGEIL